jgi:trans-2,3-dihydro-3-hydroxyanthranilate isomerase
MHFHIVDVFAEAPLEGNQLAVFTDAAGLDATRMQAIAQEMNFSETTFVTGRAPGRAAVRIFEPGRELPFAGHPTLGTAWVLAGGAREIVLELGAGDVAVRFDEGRAFMTPPPASLGAAISPDLAAELIGLEPADLDPAHTPVVSTCGPTFALIFVRSLEALKRIRTRADLLAKHAAFGSPFVVSEAGYEPGHLGARMVFDDGIAVREDAATGSANSCLAYYLAARGRRGRVVVDQGVEIKRPSRLYLDLGERIEVGGKVHAVAQGELVAHS